MNKLGTARDSSADYPWILIGLLWLVAFLNAADRSIIVAVMPSVRDEFGLTLEDRGLGADNIDTDGAHRTSRMNRIPWGEAVDPGPPVHLLRPLGGGARQGASGGTLKRIS